METKTTTAFQLFLRVALSISFLSAVTDRFGIWGNPGSAKLLRMDSLCCQLFT
jgi:hypothetical protein